MNYSIRLRQKTGLILMVLSSSFLILGSFWYADLAIIPNDWGLRLNTGLSFGIPPAIILLITIWRFKIGGLFAIAISIPAFFMLLLHLLVGDSDPRLIWSLFIITVIYLTGAILVTGNIAKY